MGLSKKIVVTGVAVHNDLTGRSVADGHPIAAVTGLQDAIDTVTGTANTANSLATTANTNASTANTNASSALASAGAVDTKVGTLASLLTTAKGNIVAAVNELFTLAANGKTLLAAAINGKGGSAADTMTFSQLSSAVTAIPNVNEATGNAVASDVRSGKTFSNGVGNGITGTMDLSNLLSANIKNAVTIAGVTGNYVAKRFVTGTWNGGGIQHITGLAFTPTFVFVMNQSSYDDGFLSSWDSYGGGLPGLNHTYSGGNQYAANNANSKIVANGFDWYCFTAGPYHWIAIE